MLELVVNNEGIVRVDEKNIFNIIDGEMVPWENGFEANTVNFQICEKCLKITIFHSVYGKRKNDYLKVTSFKYKHVAKKRIGRNLVIITTDDERIVVKRGKRLLLDCPISQVGYVLIDKTKVEILDHRQMKLKTISNKL